MSVPTYRICVTCVGGYYSYDTLQALRDADDFSVYILGVDANPDVHGRYFVDDFAVVPIAEDGEKEYIQRLLDLAKEYRFDAVIPLSEGETRVIARYKDILAANGIKAPVSEYSVVEKMTDKLKMLSWLHERGVDVGPFSAVTSHLDVRRVAKELGYPAHSIVLKPRISTGARGIFIADAREKEFQLRNQRHGGVGSLEAIMQYVTAHGLSLDTYLAVPYYGNTIYDVDCLVAGEEVIDIVTRLRQWDNPLSPMSEGCKLVIDTVVREYARKLCQVFGVESVGDFDIALDESNRPRLLDASCRLSGSVGAAYAAGINIPAQLVRILSGLPLAVYPQVEGIEVRPVRYMMRVPDSHLTKGLDPQGTCGD